MNASHERETTIMDTRKKLIVGGVASGGLMLLGGIGLIGAAPSPPQPQPPQPAAVDASACHRRWWDASCPPRALWDEALRKPTSPGDQNTYAYEHELNGQGLPDVGSLVYSFSSGICQKRDLLPENQVVYLVEYGQLVQGSDSPTADQLRPAGGGTLSPAQAQAIVSRGEYHFCPQHLVVNPTEAPAPPPPTPTPSQSTRGAICDALGIPRIDRGPFGNECPPGA
jgi:hypothetical protein